MDVSGLVKLHVQIEHHTHRLGRDTRSYITVCLIQAHISILLRCAGWFFAEGEISVDTFIQHFILARGEAQTSEDRASIWHHIASWCTNLEPHAACTAAIACIKRSNLMSRAWEGPTWSRLLQLHPAITWTPAIWVDFQLVQVSFPIT
jgi:hypothetical protein